MANNMLRAPLIKSAVLLAVFSLVVYLTATSSDGSVWSSLGTIFLAIFRAAQLGVGLILALALCFIVLSAIFIGGLALISRKSAAKLFDQSCQAVSTKVSYLRSLTRRDDSPSDTISLEGFGEQLKSEVSGELHRAMESLRLSRQEDAVSIAGVQGRVSEMAEVVSRVQDDLRQLDERVEKAMARSQQTSEDPAIAELSRQIENVERLSGESRATVADLVHQLGSLQADLNEIRASGGAAKGKLQGAVKQRGEGEVHRLFSYIDDPAAQQKIAQLVTETLQREMTYAEVIDHLVTNTGKAAGKVLTAHPSLTKDYIRERRKKG